LNHLYQKENLHVTTI